MSRGVFVVGTDTGVGKTTVSLGLVAALSQSGRRVAAMKPCETGDGDDAARLHAATGRALDPALTNPYAFHLPAAPEIAARRQGARVELHVIDDAYRALAADADITIVEGAGGLLVPLAGGVTIADLVARLDLPVLIVARTRLGTINHTLLTAEVARRRGLRVVGVIFSRAQRRRGPEEDETVSTIVRHGELRCFGVLPYLPARQRDPLALAATVRAHVQLERLVATIENY
jgi:dethiobiotin synthetase